MSWGVVKVESATKSATFMPLSKVGRKPSSGLCSRDPLAGPKVSRGWAAVEARARAGGATPDHESDIINARRLDSMSYLIANPIPSASRSARLLIPTTSPLRFKSGPPLLPLLVAASVWT